MSKTNSNKATAMIVTFGHSADARAYANAVKSCGVAATVETRDVVVALTTARNNEVALNLRGEGRVFYR